MARRHHPPVRRPLRLLVLAPGEPGQLSLELIGPHPLVACAASAHGRFVYTVVAPADEAPRFASLPPPHELVVASSWRLLPRERLCPLAPASRSHAALACLAALGARGWRAAEGPYDAVHGWETAGALAAGAAARALGLAWGWTPPAAAADEHAHWVGTWAAREARLLLLPDRARLGAARVAHAPASGRLRVLPAFAAAAWDGGPASARASGGTRRLALLCGRDATGAAAAAVLQALAWPDARAGRAPAWAVTGIGDRAGAAAAAVRREARRLGLVPGLAWRDLAPGCPLPHPRRDLGRADVAVALGEPPPPPLLAWLWRAGIPVLLVGDGARPAPPGVADGVALSTCPPDPSLLAARLARPGAAPASPRPACRAAWRAWAAENAAAAAGGSLSRAYARLADAAGHGGRGELRLPGRG